MPTYDYRCKACGHSFELYQTMSEGEKRKCPQCAKNALERLIGAGAGLIFKGSGYYLTDYRSKSYEDGAKAERDAAKPAETESKPAAQDKAASKPSAEGASEKPAKSEPEKKTAPALTPKSEPSAQKRAQDGAAKSAPKRKR